MHHLRFLPSCPAAERWDSAYSGRKMGLEARSGWVLGIREVRVTRL